MKCAEIASRHASLAASAYCARNDILEKPDPFTEADTPLLSIHDKNFS
jgi:hypothetical protein